MVESQTAAIQLYLRIRETRLRTPAMHPLQRSLQMRRRRKRPTRILRHNLITTLRPPRNAMDGLVITLGLRQVRGINQVPSLLTLFIHRITIAKLMNQQRKKANPRDASETMITCTNCLVHLLMNKKNPRSELPVCYRRFPT